MQPDWRRMDSAPTDGSHVLLYTTSHGVVEAWFSPGKWQHFAEGREYDGPVWVCADDAFQIEVEEWDTELWHGPATHWMPVPEPPHE